MAELGAVVGESGSGKSTSIRNLNPEETFIINVAGKPLPLKGYKKNYTQLKQDPQTKKFTGNVFTSRSVDQITKILKLVSKTMPYIKQIIIDDKLKNL